MLNKKDKFKTVSLPIENIVVHPDHSNVSVLVLDSALSKSIPGDSTKSPMRSKISLVINDNEMTDAHSIHSEISSNIGSFSHWENYIIFNPGIPQADIKTMALKIPKRLFK